MSTSTMLSRFFLNDRRVLWLIVLNAIFVFSLGFPELPATVAARLSVADDVITALFVVEVFVKVREHGWRGYIRSGWNRFDFVLIVLSLPSLASHTVDVRGLDLNFLLVLRVCRIFKFFRFLRFVPGIDELLRGVQRALRASVMLLLAFFIALFMISLLSTKLFGGIAPEYYGDPVRSLYSTFKIFTVEGWFEIPDEVTARMSGVGAFFARFYFAALLLGAGVMGLSLVNSVFVDAMVSDNNDTLEKKVDALREEIASLREQLVGGAGGAGRAVPASRTEAPDDEPGDV